MNIREIRTSDNQEMENIVKRSLESFDLALPGTAYYDPQLGQLAEYYERQEKASYWVAVDETDDVLGGAGIGPFDASKGIGELQKLYVKPEAQGCGLARQLVTRALEFAKEHYEYCYLETFEKLEAANTLYAKFGFQRLDQPLEGTEHSACDAWYMKKLG
ncbi:GNAT family N-acetyltransferase [Atopococcus tabaci]|uniref:GNAT family N-acetyltransferase n=1 Tax=Atopococcus tabaci TaxID=269774 RepID=UPI000403FFC0|nr:GNAT family N-acetyltransferase [Atopococcus tabaci]